MGERTFVKNSKEQGLKINPMKFMDQGFDLPLFLVSITLVIFGILMVYSASWDFSLLIYDSPTQIFSRQMAWLALGALAALLAAYFDYHNYRRLAVLGMIGTVILLLAVLVINEVRLGAVRSLSEGSYQPSELAKLMTILYLSVWLFAKRDQLRDVSFGLVPLAAILGLIGGLIFLQPDLSAVITVFAIGGLMFFLAGGDLKQMGILAAGSVIFGAIVVRISPTGSGRIADFMTALSDPTQASYHLRRSYEAFVNGGWFGVGIGRANTKLTGLPVPPTDSIFAVVGEEMGVIGASILVMLFCVLIWRGMVIANRAPDDLGRLLAAGLTLWLGLEAIVNMAVMVGLLPFAGNALPFISAGGSNLLFSMIAVGILMNISRSSRVKEENTEKTISAFVNLRGRKRGRRVSRPRRPTSTSG
ncbi:MAG: putative peptidoglycan glycosyltransferase FtsW [Anaerolineales bacterium]|nr:putative peptidoglycan glycosyltransferase FtsW [Anaerolineales bacterium]